MTVDDATTPRAAPVGAARRSQLRHGSELVRTAVATVELLRADAGGVARASGWWSPAGLLLHRTRPGRTVPYVCTPAGQLGPAVLRALRAGGLHPVPAPVAVGSVREVLAVARGAHRRWLGELGARDPGDVALLRWEVRGPDRRAVAVRALVTGPAGAGVLHDRGRDGTFLVPTDAAAESAELARVRDVLVARCHLDVAAAARGPTGGWRDRRIPTIGTGGQ